MMMRALCEGMSGGQMLYQPGHESLNEAQNGYQPNPDGLFEVGQLYYMNARFLRNYLIQGSLVKILYDGLPFLPMGEYKIVFMMRDADEIKASCDRVDAHLRQTGVKENTEKGHVFDVFRPYNQADIDHVLGICHARNDMDLIAVPYRDVIEQPLRVFTAINNFGIPLDPDRAASVVKPEHYRFKNEHSKSGNDRACA